MDLLRTVEDHSNAAIGCYFKSNKNYPWIIYSEAFPIMRVGFP
jgi:hypothetical protein